MAEVDLSKVIYTAESDLFNRAEYEGFKSQAVTDSQNLAHIKKFTSINTDELDPIFDRNARGEIPTLQDWYQEMYGKYSTDKKLKLYVTEVGKFGASPSPYDTRAMTNPFYNRYFQDMMDWFKEQSQQERYQSKKIDDYKVLLCRSLF